MTETLRKIELLAPAANADIAIEAILHGADAVYIGPPDHGARKAASNSIADIKRVVDFAHPFGVKVYATVNTIIYESELKSVEQLIRDLYRIGVDALIVQDMGILRLDLPPIPLHASTQCDTRTPEKARFLQDVGFSQIVLARELTLPEIKSICESVTVPIECFVHGALCVSYSGRCHASQTLCRRSANRGECAQICRLPYTLTDASGKILERNKHLLSLKDFNASDDLEKMLEAGVSSFKIEGRLKDAGYVKNIVAFYRKRLDEIIARSPEKYQRSSFGKSEIMFVPDPQKSFNRGFTHYFLNQRRPEKISSPLTPKSMGEVITDISKLHNGDGISFFNEKGQYEGFLVNGIDRGRIITNRPVKIPKGATLHRTSDSLWQKTLARPTATRRLYIDITLHKNSIEAVDERGVATKISYDFTIETAKTPKDIRSVFDKFGNTIYHLRNFNLSQGFDIFIPPSQLAEARRLLLEALETTAKATYPFEKRRPERREVFYPASSLDYRDNVANSMAEEFYLSHGVKSIEYAMEISDKADKDANSAERLQKKNPDSGKRNRRKEGPVVVMTTRHCILREIGRCLKEAPASKRDFKLPLSITTGLNRFLLDFDCRNCEMNVSLHPGHPTTSA